MFIKLLLILSLFYGFTIQGQTDKGFNSIKEFGEFIDNSWRNHVSKGDTNPRYLIEKIDNCLLSVDIETNNSIRLAFVNKKIIQKVHNDRSNTDIKNTPKRFQCHGVVSGIKIVKKGDNFLFDSDGHHISTSLKLLEIDKEEIIFEYTTSSFFGFMNHSSKTIGVLNLKL